MLERAQACTLGRAVVSFFFAQGSSLKRTNLHCQQVWSKTKTFLVISLVNYSQTCELRPPKGLGICGRISQVVSFARLGSKNLNRVVHHGTHRAPCASYHHQRSVVPTCMWGRNWQRQCKWSLQTRWSLVRSAFEGKVGRSKKCFSLNLTYVVAFPRLIRSFGPTSGVRNSHFSGGRIFKNALRTFESASWRDWNCMSAIFRWSLLSGGRKDRFDCKTNKKPITTKTTVARSGKVLDAGFCHQGLCKVFISWQTRLQGQLQHVPNNHNFQTPPIFVIFQPYRFTKRVTILPRAVEWKPWLAATHLTGAVWGHVSRKQYCKSRIFRMHFISSISYAAASVRNKMRTKNSKQVRESAAISGCTKISCIRKVGGPKDTKI